MVVGIEASFGSDLIVGVFVFSIFIPGDINGRERGESDKGEEARSRGQCYIKREPEREREERENLETLEISEREKITTALSFQISPELG